LSASTEHLLQEQLVRSAAGPSLIVAGLGLALIGLLVWSGALTWFGRLPGDIRIERENTRVYIPIVSMLVLSVVLSLCGALFRRFR
jgi:di/tricarboxylate transporter